MGHLTYLDPLPPRKQALSVTDFEVQWICFNFSSSFFKYKKDDGEYINEKELRRGSAQQNPNLLECLKEEMRKLNTEVCMFVMTYRFS